MSTLIKSLAVALVLMSTAQAYAEPLLTRPKLVGEITFSQSVRACWTANDCEMLAPYRTWLVWKLKENPQLPYWTEDAVCVTSGLIRRDPTECAWVTPTPYQVHSYIEQ